MVLNDFQNPPGANKIKVHATCLFDVYGKEDKFNYENYLLMVYVSRISFWAKIKRKHAN
jgi:hypothetical protein